MRNYIGITVHFISNKMLCAALPDDPNIITQQKSRILRFEKIISKFDITTKRVFNVAGRMLQLDRCGFADN